MLRNVNAKVYLIGLAFFLPIFLSAQTDKEAQQAALEKIVRGMIESKNYIFNANAVTPMYGDRRLVTLPYNLRIAGDSVIAELPYFGRAYSAHMSMADGGIAFTSIQNKYIVKEQKKGGWHISIRPEGQLNARELYLIVYDNGSATLNVTSSNRDAISFSGYISQKKTGEMKEQVK